MQDEGGIVTRHLGEALRAHGYDVDAGDINATMGIPKRVAIASLTGSQDSSAIDRIHGDFRKSILDYYNNDPGVDEIPGITELFERLRNSGVLIAVDTGFDRETTRAVLGRMPWKGLVDASIASDEVERGRPDPQMILELMDQLGISDSQDVAKIGDTPSDLKQGTSAGCKLVIGVTYGSHTREELEIHPHTHLVDSVHEVTEILLGVASTHA